MINTMTEIHEGSFVTAGGLWIFHPEHILSATVDSVFVYRHDL